MNGIRKIGIHLSFALGIACSAFAGETVTVDNVTDLTNHLDRLNRLNTKAFDESGYTGNRYDTIILKKGFYDVSGCEMLCSTEKKGGLDYIDSLSHIAISWLTLKGETDDPNDVVIYGDKSNRVVYMWLGKIQNVTISNGYAKVSKTINGWTLGKNGGGLASRTQSSYLNNCIVTCCRADSDGGGVAGASCSDTIVENCTAANGGGLSSCYAFNRGIVRNNTATADGGGMYNCVADGAVISNNVAAGSGGGIRYVLNRENGLTNCLVACNSANTGGGVHYGDAKGVNCCIISNNAAKTNGGGLYASKATDTVIIGNTATNTSSSYGGGAYGNDGSYQLLRCQIVGNAASRGGGISKGIRADDCHIVSNAATYGGGAYYSCSASNTVFAFNTATQNGGAAYDMQSNYIYTNCTVCGNTARCGGGFSHVLAANNCVISNNAALQGGGIYNSTMRGGRLVRNLVRNPSGASTGNNPLGGGAAADSTTGTYACFVYDADVSGNAVDICDGASGDHCGGAGERVHFINCRIYDNFAYVGGAINWGSAVGCIISNNVSCSTSGSCHSMIRGTTKVFDCDIHNQILCSPGPLSGCRIHDLCGKWTLPEGANVYTSGTFSASDKSLFSNNLGGEHSMTNCLIVNNKCGNVLSSAGNGKTTAVVNCTVASNVCTSMYGGFSPSDNPGSILVLRNTIIAGNKNSSGDDLNFRHIYGTAGSSVVIENCLIGPGGWMWTPETWPVPSGYSWTGLIQSNNAGFMKDRDPEHPFSLRVCSPARRKGTVDDWMENAYDIRGDIEDGKYKRLRDGKVDLGCYQCWLDSVGMMLFVK